MIIQAAEIADAEELLDIYGPYVTETAITFEYEIPSLQEFRERIEKISSRLPYLKAVEDGRIIGYAYAAPFISRRAYDWSVEATIYLRQSEKRKGTGRALYGKLEELLQKMGVLNMNACIAVPKQEDAHLTRDSILFHEKLGFQPVGTFHDSGFKFHTWYDMIWMEKMLGEHSSTQPEVRFGTWRNLIEN